MGASVAGWVAARVQIDEVPGRPRLAELAVELGHSPEFWRHFVRHTPEERYFAQLYRDENVDVWLICWLEQQETGFHDHDRSSGAVYVCEGTLLEDRLNFNGRGFVETTRKWVAGTVFDFDAAYIHRMRGGPEPSTSIHVYAPALWRMGYYEPDRSGALCRASITYADELGAGSYA